MIGNAPICLECKHFHRDSKREGFTCDAFPDGVPEEIIMGEFDHRKPHPDDRGIQFESVSPVITLDEA